MSCMHNVRVLDIGSPSVGVVHKGSSQSNHSQSGMCYGKWLVSWGVACVVRSGLCRGTRSGLCCGELAYVVGSGLCREELVVCVVGSWLVLWGVACVVGSGLCCGKWLLSWGAACVEDSR